MKESERKREKGNLSFVLVLCLDLELWSEGAEEEETPLMITAPYVCSR
jgi:hypothetical protein